MNIKDFLIENYIYIIIIIVLVIITIIGFLADKKKNGDKRPNTMGGNLSNQGMGGNAMPYQPQQNTNGPINYGQPNGAMGNNMQYNGVTNAPPVIAPMPNVAPIGQEMMQPTNGMIAPQQMPQPAPINNPMPVEPQPVPMQPVPNPINEMNYNAPQPVEPLNIPTSNPTESMFQPLSEQKPSFAPVEPNVQAINNPMPVGPQAVPMQPEPIGEPIAMQPMPNEFQPQMQPSSDPMNMAAAPMANQMPNPVPVQPLPNPGDNTVPNPITPPQPVSPQPINFTYGNGDNNGFMQ